MRYAIVLVLGLLISIPYPVHAETPKERALAIVARKNACIATAVMAREQTYTDGIDSYTQGMHTAFATRAATIRRAYHDTTGTVLAEAAKDAFAEFSDAMNIVKNQWAQVQTAAVAGYKTALAACVVQATAPAPPIVPPPTTRTVLFSDDFHRPDSPSLGNGWSQRCQGSSASVSVASGLVLNSGSVYGDCAYWRTDIPKSDGIAIVSTFSSDDLRTKKWFSRGIGVRGTVTDGFISLFKGYGVEIRTETGSVTITDNGSRKATGSFSFDAAGVYQIEVVISAAPQNWMDVYVWNADRGAKPAHPTVSFHNQGQDYALASVGDAFYVNFGQDDFGTSVLKNHSYSVESLKGTGL